MLKTCILGHGWNGFQNQSQFGPEIAIFSKLVMFIFEKPGCQLHLGNITCGNWGSRCIFYEHLHSFNTLQWTFWHQSNVNRFRSWSSAAFKINDMFITRLILNSVQQCSPEVPRTQNNTFCATCFESVSQKLG